MRDEPLHIMVRRERRDGRIVLVFPDDAAVGAGGLEVGVYDTAEGCHTDASWDWVVRNTAPATGRDAERELAAYVRRLRELNGPVPVKTVTGKKGGLLARAAAR